MNSKLCIKIWSIIRGNTLGCAGFKMLSSGRKEVMGGWLIRNKAEICSFKERGIAIIKNRVRILLNCITKMSTAMILTIKSNSNEIH